MTDDEVTTALRRVRGGTRAEWLFHYAPVPVICTALLVSPVDSFEGAVLAGMAVGLVVGLVLHAARLRKDRVATNDERRLLLRGLLEKRVRSDGTMHPSMAIALVAAAGVLGAAVVRARLSDWNLDRLPLGFGIAIIFVIVAARLDYEHRVRVPELQRTLHSLTTPTPTPAPG